MNIFQLISITLLIVFAPAGLSQFDGSLGDHVKPEAGRTKVTNTPNTGIPTTGGLEQTPGNPTDSIRPNPDGRWVTGSDSPGAQMPNSDSILPNPDGRWLTGSENPGAQAPGTESIQPNPDGRWLKGEGKPTEMTAEETPSESIWPSGGVWMNGETDAGSRAPAAAETEMMNTNPLDQ